MTSAPLCKPHFVSRWCTPVLAVAVTGSSLSHDSCLQFDGTDQGFLGFA